MRLNLPLSTSLSAPSPIGASSYSPSSLSTKRVSLNPPPFAWRAWINTSLFFSTPTHVLLLTHVSSSSCFFISTSSFSPPSSPLLPYFSISTLLTFITIDTKGTERWPLLDPSPPSLILHFSGKEIVKAFLHAWVRVDFTPSLTCEGSPPSPPLLSQGLEPIFD